MIQTYDKDGKHNGETLVLYQETWFVSLDQIVDCNFSLMAWRIVNGADVNKSMRAFDFWEFGEGLFKQAFLLAVARDDQDASPFVYFDDVCDGPFVFFVFAFVLALVLAAGVKSVVQVGFR